MSEFSDRFRLLKDESGVTLKELSEKLDITVPNLSYYMKGREPSYDILIRIADYFNVTTDWLIGRTDTRTPESLDMVKIIEKDVGELYNVKLSDVALKNYLELQEVMTSVLDDIYILYCVTRQSDDFLNTIHKLLMNPSVLFARYMWEFTKFMGTPEERLQITKENVTKFLNSTDLISDAMGAMLIPPTIKYANFLSQAQDIPKKEYDSIHTIIDFVYERFDRKYPDDVFNDLIGKLNKQNK